MQWWDFTSLFLYHQLSETPHHCTWLQIYSCIIGAQFFNLFWKLDGNELRGDPCSLNTTELVVEMRPEKNSGPYSIWTHNLCDTSAVLYQLSLVLNLRRYIWIQHNDQLPVSLLAQFVECCHIYNFHIFTAFDGNVLCAFIFHLNNLILP